MFRGAARLSSAMGCAILGSQQGKLNYIPGRREAVKRASGLCRSAAVPSRQTSRPRPLHPGAAAFRSPENRNTMSQVVIENPIINSPFEEPTRHFRFADEGITNEIVEGRRVSSYFVPIAQPRKKGAKQLAFDTEWTQDRIEENKLVNQIRDRVKIWRQGGYVGVTPTTAGCSPTGRTPTARRSSSSARSKPSKRPSTSPRWPGSYGDAWIENALREANEHVEPRPAPHRLQDGHRLRQDRGHGHAHRLADAQQARQPAGCPLLRHVPDRHARASPSATGCACCCPTIRRTTTASATSSRRNHWSSSARRRSSSPTSTPSGCARRSPPASSPRRSSPRARRAPSPRRPTRWCAASAANWATRRTSSSSTTKPTTATAASPTART